MQNATLYQMTGRAWLLSIMLSTTLMTGLFLSEEIHFNSLNDLFYNHLLSNNYGITVAIFSYLTVIHFLLGLPILFISYLGFSQLKKMKLKEFIVRPIIVTFPILLILGTMYSIFGPNVSYLLKENFIYVMLFATTFILMTQEKLIEDISLTDD